MARAPARAVEPGDTIIVAGPYQFSKQGGGQSPQVFFAYFTATTTPGRRYIIKTERVSGSLTSVEVKLNGSVVATTSEVQSAAGAARMVVLEAADTIRAAVAGTNGSTVRVTVFSITDPTYQIAGPHRLSIGAGYPLTRTDTFTVAPEDAGPFRFTWLNGPDGAPRVLGARAYLNGTLVLNYGCGGQPCTTFPNPFVPSAGEVKELTGLVVGQNVLTMEIGGTTGGVAEYWVSATDTTKPAITVTSPPYFAFVAADTVVITGSVADQTPTSVTAFTIVGGGPTHLEYAWHTVTRDGGSFVVRAHQHPFDGEPMVFIQARDAALNVTQWLHTVRRDTHDPVLSVSAPTEGHITKFDTVHVAGTASDPPYDYNPNLLNIDANGIALPLSGGVFSGVIPLVDGENVVSVTATDSAGNTTVVTRQVWRDSKAPVLSLTTPAEGAATEADSITVGGTVTDATAVSLSVNGAGVAVQNGSFTTKVALAAGSNTITVVATDAATNSATEVRHVTRGSAALPPDPATIASPLDRTVATTVAAATQFLYTGANPIQTGVAPATIDPKRVAVLKGKVNTRDGSALGGVEITILDHPEIGQTLTRADGAFDIAVNGGGLLTVTYKKAGFLPVQRQVQATLQGYEQLDDVVLIQLDTAATTVDFTVPIDVHRGSPMADGDGGRRATLFFQQGTEATMTLPDGTTQPLASVTVRATEYSVGETGPLALPAPLPGTAAHTYALELSVDEAIAAGATRVQFSKPVVAYVENFLKLPVGLRLPLAFADQKKGTWVPMANGTILEIVSITDGRANISVDTAGTVADSATLAALGITAAEREALATTYSVGQTLWRLSTTHFTALGVFARPGPRSRPLRQRCRSAISRSPSLRVRQAPSSSAPRRRSGR